MSNPVETPVAPAPKPEPESRLGPIGRARASLTAIEVLLRLREDQTAPTAEDLAALRHWPGWGPLAPALSDGREGTWAEIGEQLQLLLSPREYRQAEQGTPTAYYTPDRIADACWTALRDLGFRGGRILEPGCGAGTFINHTPDRMNVEWFGVERDPTTAGIAALLHPKAQIINARLQDAGLQSNSVDAVLGNVPYGNFQVHDKTAPKAVTDSIHNYFIWRSVQALRPGGVAILLTSRYTMDSADDTARRAIAKHADLLGAIRLPNGALAEGGTGVLADIVIVRRRDTDGPLNDSWMEVSEVPTVSGQYANNYFLQHPEHVLGTFEQGRAAQYGHTLAVKAPEGQDLAAALGEAFNGITAAARDAGREWRVAIGAQPFTKDTLPFPVREDGRKEGSFHLVDGKPHEVVDGELVAVERAGKELPKLIALRDATLKLIEAETDHDTPDEQLDPLRAEVNRLYDAYARAHGPINRFTLAEGQVDEETGEKAVSRRYPRLGGFRRDPDVVSVLALEDFDDETQTAEKAPLLLRRVNRRIERPTSAQTPEEALSLCLNFKNKIDVPTIAQLLGIEEDQVQAALGELVFPEPDTGDLLTRGAYLSGPVVDKLERAEFLLSQGRDDLQRHVDDLRGVQPEPLPPEDIKAKLGAPWIPVEDVTAFAEEMLGARVDIIHVAKTATWNVDMPMTIPEAATSEWGTSRVNAFELLDLALNGQAPKVYDTYRLPDGGSRRVRNDKETMLAESKMTALMRRFASWVWEDPDRSDRLATDYNRIFNSTVLPKHDGSHLTVDGMDAEFTPYEHQWDFVQRVLSAEEGSLCPYPVGAGKTATMFMTAVKLKQLGLVNKPMIVVPNHLLEQISRDGKKLFPNAKILMAGKKDLADARSRMLFAARCATGDWDAIVMTHNSFGRLGVHPVTEATYLEELANEYRIALSAIDGDDANQRRIKEIAKMVDRFDARASDLRSKATDAGVTYENLGVDFLQVDEAHLFKNLALPATTEGMALGKPSKRATDLDLKLIVTRERTGRDNVTALYSGTFISNSVREMYVFKHYTMPKRLEKLGLGSPDAWAANFIQFESRPEVGVDGVSFRLKRRPVEYTNADEALALFAEVAELRPPEEFKIKRPKRVDRFVEIDATPNLVQYVGSISDRIDLIQQGKVKPFQDNMLNVITDGRKAALDLELVGMEPDGPGKAGAIIRNVLQVHEETKDLKLPGDPDDVAGGLQVVFCDLGTPSKERGSQVYGKIRRGLIEGLPGEGLPGIPRERIRFIHDYNSDLAKEQLFTDCRSGKVSVLFMSSEKGGTGVNVQTRGVALHHADPPHKPAEWEQREGRLWRPGNGLIDLDMEVQFFRYIALNSFDSYMFQQLERKQRPIVQIMSGRKVGRVIQEIDPVGAGFGQAKAIATGNPLLLELADVNGELTVLLNDADGHRQAQARMKRKVEVLSDQIREAERTLPGMRAMADAVTAAGDDDTWRTADGRLIDPDDVAGVLAQTAQGSKPTLDLDAGYLWRGLNVGFTWHRRQQFGSVAYEAWAHLVAGGHEVDVRLNLSWFGKGQAWRIVKALGEAADEAVTAPVEIEQKVVKQRVALEDTRSHIGRPFEKHAELEDVRERKAALEERISGAAIASGRESGSGPQFDPGAAADGREMTEAEMAMHDATVMAGMLGGTAVVVSEGQIIGGARVIDRTDVDLRTPDLADLGQYQEALRALIAAAAADGDVTAWAQGADEVDGFREAFAEWAQDWALERTNLPEDRPAWLRDWLQPESADTRQMLVGEAAWIVWQQARATEPEEAPPAPQDAPTPTPEPEPVPAPEESAAPPAPPQAGPQEPAPAAPETPQAPAEDTVEPAPADSPTGTPGQAPLQDLVNAFGDRVMVGHIGGPQPARTHQSAGWAIMAVLSEDQVKGLVSAVALDNQPVSTEPGTMPTDRVREWIAEQQQTPTAAFFASTSSELPPTMRGDGDVRLSTRADGLAIEQGDVSTTILWEELPAWIDVAVTYDAANRSTSLPAWRYGRLDHEIHFRRDERNQSAALALNALADALRETAPPTDEQLAEARDRFAPPAIPATTTDLTDNADDAPAEESAPQEPQQQLPEDAKPVPGAEGYHYTEKGRTVRLYTEAGEEVGTAKWSYSKYRYLGDVQGDTVRGTEDGATVAKRMANHHAVVYGDLVHRPTLDDQGRDPVWILHNGSDTLVFGVSPEDDTAKAAMWTGGGFKESRKVGGWYLPRTWKEPTRRQRVDDAVRVLAAAGRTVTAHTSRAERQQPPQRPARLPELNVTAPNLDDVPQFFNAPPFTGQDDLQDVQALEAAYDRWSQHPTVRAYLNQDNDARPDGFGTPDNPIAELHIAYHRARLALREPVPGGPDEIVRRVYGVAAWCQELEVVVADDLLDPLQDVYAAAHLLAARSQATIAALTAERAAAAENAPAPAPTEEAPAAAQQEPGIGEQPGEPVPAPSETAPAAATEEQVEQSPAAPEPPAPDDNGLLAVSDEFAILYASYKELVPAGVADDGVTWDTSRIVITGSGVRADGATVERLMDAGLLEYGATLNVDITPAGRQRINELERTDRPEPAVGDRVLFVATGRLGIVGGYATKEHGREAEVVCDRDDWPNGWDIDIAPLYIVTVQPGAMEPEAAAEAYRVAALRQFPGTLTDPALREPALEAMTAAALTAPPLAQAARANDLNNFIYPLAAWVDEWVTEEWADVPPADWPDWVRAYFREGDDAVDDRNGLYAELAGPLYAQLRTSEPEPASAPPVEAVAAVEAEREPETAPSTADTGAAEQLDVFGAAAEAESTPQEELPESAPAQEASTGASTRVEETPDTVAAMESTEPAEPQPALDTGPAVEPSQAAPAPPPAAPEETAAPTLSAEQLFGAGGRIYHDGDVYPVSVLELSEDGTVLRSRGGAEVPVAEVTREEDMPPVTSERVADGWWRISYRDRTYTVAHLPDELAVGRLATLTTVIVDENSDLVGRSFGTPTDSTIIWGYHHPGVLSSDVVGWWTVGGGNGPLPEYTAAERAYMEAGPPVAAQMSFDLDAAAETTASIETVPDVDGAESTPSAATEPNPAADTTPEGEPEHEFDDLAERVDQLPAQTRGEALDNVTDARSQFGPDAPQTDQAVEDLEQLLTPPHGDAENQLLEGGDRLLGFGDQALGVGDQAAPEETALPDLDVVLLDVDVPPLDPAEPYATDAEAQADIDRLGGAFTQWAALPSVQRYYEADRQQRPAGNGDPTNPVVQLAEAYRDAERTLREGPVGSPDDLVRQVHTVAAWSGALEPVVGEDLRGPLSQVREAAGLLASRSQATVESFEAELEALATNSAGPTAGTESAAAETEPTAEQDASASPRLLEEPPTATQDGAAADNTVEETGRRAAPDDALDVGTTDPGPEPRDELEAGADEEPDYELLYPEELGQPLADVTPGREAATGQDQPVQPSALPEELDSVAVAGVAEAPELEEGSAVLGDSGGADDSAELAVEQDAASLREDMAMAEEPQESALPPIPEAPVLDPIDDAGTEAAAVRADARADGLRALWSMGPVALGLPESVHGAVGDALLQVGERVAAEADQYRAQYAAVVGDILNDLTNEQELEAETPGEELSPEEPEAKQAPAEQTENESEQETSEPEAVRAQRADSIQEASESAPSRAPEVREGAVPEQAPAESTVDVPVGDARQTEAVAVVPTEEPQAASDTIGTAAATAAEQPVSAPAERADQDGLSQLIGLLQQVQAEVDATLAAEARQQQSQNNPLAAFTQGIAQLSTELDPPGAPQPTPDLGLNGFGEVEQAYAAASQHAAEFNGAREWRQLTQLWQNSHRVWSNARDALARSTARQATGIRAVCRNVGARVADGVARLSHRLAIRLANAGRHGSPGYRALRWLSGTAENVASRLRGPGQDERMAQIEDTLRDLGTQLRAEVQNTQAGQPTMVEALDNAARLVNESFAGAERHTREYNGAPEWRRLTSMWPAARRVLGEAVLATAAARYGTQLSADSRWQGALRTVGVNTLETVARLSYRMAERLANAGRDDSPGRRAIQDLGLTAQRAVSEVRQDAPAERVAALDRFTEAVRDIDQELAEILRDEPGHGAGVPFGEPSRPDLTGSKDQKTDQKAEFPADGGDIRFVSANGRTGGTGVGE
ncbi:hypothetical protein ACWDBD_37335 [Streptomyces sp. NPDC001118]